jgi:hypothetical protein
MGVARMAVPNDGRLRITRQAGDYIAFTAVAVLRPLHHPSVPAAAVVVLRPLHHPSVAVKDNPASRGLHRIRSVVAVAAAVVVVAVPSVVVVAVPSVVALAVPSVVALAVLPVVVALQQLAVQGAQEELLRLP